VISNDGLTNFSTGLEGLVLANLDYSDGSRINGVEVLDSSFPAGTFDFVILQSDGKGVALEFQTFPGGINLPPETRYEATLRFLVEPPPPLIFKDDFEEFILR